MSDKPGSGAPVFEEPNFTVSGEADDDLDGDLEDTEDEDLEDEDLEDEDLEDEDLEDDEDDLVEDDLVDEHEGAGDAAVAVAPGNRLPGGTARAVLEHVARSVVDDPDSVVIDVSPARSGVKLSLHVAPSDMGRIIGRRGRVAQALRTVVRAAAARDGSDAVVDIVD